MYIAVVGAYSKWLSVELMQSITVEKTIQVSHKIFATCDIPLRIVTDNGPTFCSEEFKFLQDIMALNICIFSAPYHSSSNSLAERE